MIINNMDMVCCVSGIQGKRFLAILFLFSMMQWCSGGVTVIGRFDDSRLPDLFAEGNTTMKNVELTYPDEGYPFISDQPQCALRLNTASRFDLPISCFPFEAGTLTMWIKVRDTTCNHKILSFYGKGGKGYFLYYRRMNNQYWIFLDIYFKGRSKNYKIGNISLNEGEWAHIGWTWDTSKGQIALYNNGKQVLEENNVELHKSIRKSCFNIGYYDHISAGTNSGAVGDIDELVIEDEAVSADEISQRYTDMLAGKHWKYRVAENVLETQLDLAEDVLRETRGLERASEQVKFKTVNFNSLSETLAEYADKISKQGSFNIDGKLERKFFVIINSLKQKVSQEREKLINHIVAMPPVELPVTRDWLPAMRVAGQLRKKHYESPYEIANAVLELYAEGINTLNTINFGTQFTWNPQVPAPIKFQPFFPPDLEFGRITTEMCHKLGIRVILHTTVGYIDRRGIDIYPNWIAYDIRSNKPYSFAETGIWTNVASLNYNHKEWRKHLFDNLHNAMKVIGADGIMPDEIHWSDKCEDGSPLTKKIFREETGYALPDPTNTSEWNNWDSPLWRAWIASRRKWLTDFASELKKEVLNPIDKNLAYMTCVTGPTKPWRYETGIDNSRQAKIGMNVNFMEAECGPTHVHKRYAYATYWPRYYREMKAVCAISDHYGSVPLTYAYPETYYGSNSEQFFVWSLTKAMGHAYWLDFPKFPKGMFNWERKHEDVMKWSSSYADIAVLFSQETSFMYGNRDEKWKYHYEFAGWCETLAERHIPYVVILDEDIAELKILSKYKTVILPNVAIISDTSADALKSYVKSGGQLIATCQTSTHNIGGVPRKTAALSELFSRNLESLETKRIQLDSAAKLFQDKRFENVAFRTLSVTGASTTGNQLKVNEYGKGRVMYFPWRPGYRHHFPGKYGRSKIFKDSRNSIEGDLILAAVQYMHPGQWLWRIDNLPHNVFINGFKQENRRIIHIVNAIGGEKANGEEITPNQRVSYPSIGERNGNKDILLKMSDFIESANIISPDFDDTIELKVQQVSGQSIISIPVSLIHRYSIVTADVGDRK